MRRIATVWTTPASTIVCNKFLIGSNGDSQGDSGRSPPAQPRGVGTRYELCASDVLAIGRNCPQYALATSATPKVASAQKMENGIVNREIRRANR